MRADGQFWLTCEDLGTELGTQQALPLPVKVTGLRAFLAMVDLAETVCTPQAPRCQECPLRKMLPKGGSLEPE